MSRPRICTVCNLTWPRKRIDGMNICPPCEAENAWCSTCQAPKPHKDFSSNPSRRSGLDSRCRDCAVGYKLQLRYGIDADEYARLLQQQDGRCAICELPSPEGQPLVVDHCHVGLQVRGLLCSQCNTAIGLLKDNPGVIARAATYVETHSAS